jgi:hypothetical protein
VAVEHHALLVDLRVAWHHRQRKPAHPLTVMSGQCRTLTGILAGDVLPDDRQGPGCAGDGEVRRRPEVPAPAGAAMDCAADVPGHVMKDIGIFIEGWITELIAPTYDAELEKAHAYALYLLLIPGLLRPWFNLVPFLKRDSEFQVRPTDRYPCAEVTVGNRC